MHDAPQTALVHRRHWKHQTPVAHGRGCIAIEYSFPLRACNHISHDRIYPSVHAVEFPPNSPQLGRSGIKNIPVTVYDTVNISHTPVKCFHIGNY